MSKRKRFIITSLILSLGFIGISFIENRFRFISIGGLTLLTVILFAWSLKEGLGRNMTLLTLILPAFFTMGVGIFWFLLPVSIFTRIPVVIIYGVGIYALCLTANIYTVSAIRTIALLRAARGVGFVLTLFTFFLVYDAILSLRTSILLTSLSVSLLSFPLFLQGLWTIPLEPKFSKDVFLTSSIFSLVVAEMAIGLYFWPVSVVVGSLFLTVAVYMLLGLGQAKLEGRLFAQTIREYLMVGILVFLGMFFATRWGG
jgi:hypothetical protein